MSTITVRSEDHELVRELRAGSEAAFDTIFRAYYKRLVHFAEGLLKERAQAEDVVQDVMFAFWRRRQMITVETSLQAYLFRATRNHVLNSLRHESVVKRGAAKAALDMIAAAVGENEIVQQEMATALEQAVADLPQRRREALRLRLQSFKYPEIAAAMNISSRTAEAHVSRAVGVIRERMAPWKAAC